MINCILSLNSYSRKITILRLFRKFIEINGRTMVIEHLFSLTNCLLISFLLFHLPARNRDIRKEVFES